MSPLLKRTNAVRPPSSTSSLTKEMVHNELFYEKNLKYDTKPVYGADDYLCIYCFSPIKIG